MFGSINPTEIIKAHVQTFREFHTERWLARDLVFIFVSPLVVAVGAALAGVRVDKDIANIFATSLSIFAGLLFNLLVLAHSIRDRIGADDQLRAFLLKSAYANVAFSILLAIFAISAIAIYIVVSPERTQVTSIILTVVILYLAVLFILALMIVVKRFHSLLWREMK